MLDTVNCVAIVNFNANHINFCQQTGGLEVGFSLVLVVNSIIKHFYKTAKAR
jgi:hypothetical protein